MTLKEAIERYTNNAEYERIHGSLQGCMEFRQLAEWLKDYKRLLEQQPCDDAISREDALMCLTGMFKLHLNYNPEDLIALFSKRIKALPPVTPQQKYVKWIVHPEIETSTPEYLMFYECSECGDKQCFCKSDIHKKRFCSNCGAKMQEVKE